MPVFVDQPQNTFHDECAEELGLEGQKLAQNEFTEGLLCGKCSQPLYSKSE